MCLLLYSYIIRISPLNPYTSYTKSHETLLRFHGILLVDGLTPKNIPIRSQCSHHHFGAPLYFFATIRTGTQGRLEDFLSYVAQVDSYADSDAKDFLWEPDWMEIDQNWAKPNVVPSGNLT